MRFPYEGGCFPLLSKVYFLECDIKELTEKVFKLFTDRKMKHGEPFNSFKDLLEGNLPFNDPVKYSIVPTKSKWQAFFSNNEHGYMFSITILTNLLKCKGVEIVSLLRDYEIQVNGWGGGSIAIASGNDKIRGVGMFYNDDDRPEFYEYGTVQDFENPDNYKTRLSKNKFTPQILNEYCKALDIDFFNEDFYLPPGKEGYIIEQVYEVTSKHNPKSLEQVRKEMFF